MSAICPLGHKHPIAKDPSGFDVYGRAEGIANWACVYRRFRVRLAFRLVAATAP
jgi:hypothetical protein